MKEKIYIADDEKNILELLQNFLQNDGYDTRIFETGDALLEAFQKEPADLVILDIMMPGKDGLECCRILRSKSTVPIILLTARDTELDYVQGISIGSDDYLTKPFRPTILLMKVKALLRRTSMNRQAASPASEKIELGDLCFHPQERPLQCKGKDLELTQTELRIVAYMLSNPQKIYSREELLNHIWGYDSCVETRVTDETMRRIRRKLNAAGSTVTIETVWGVGYRFQEAERQ